MLTKNCPLVIPLVLLCHVICGQNNWQFVEETNIKGAISGTITQGYIFKVDSRDYYVINERTSHRVRTRNPSVKIFQSGSDYKLVIQDFDEPIICKKIKEVIETQIDGDFKGWDGETIFKMLNEQIWQQASYAYIYHYAYSPNVLIYEFNGSWTMRVEEVAETIEVKKLDTGVVGTQVSGTEIIETQINGEFKGWDGETIFKMSNGQVWQQSSYAYMYHYAYSPSVIIYESGGIWKMKVAGVAGAIEVKKIK